MGELRKQLEGRQKETLKENFERARQEAKAEAGKKGVNVDPIIPKRGHFGGGSSEVRGNGCRKHVAYS